MARRPIKFLLGLLLAIIALVAITRLLAPATAPPRVLPDPNGYDDFVSAGDALVYSRDFSRTNLQELRSQLATNAESLRLIREGLSKECMAPSWESSTNYINRHMHELGKFKALARLLDAEARLAELDQRTNDSAKISLEIIRFGQEICHGGMLVDRLVGIACEDVGSRSLQKVVDGLNAMQCRDYIRTLEKILASRETAESVVRTEVAWRRANAGLANEGLSLMERIQRHIPIRRFNQEKQSLDGFVLKMKVKQLDMRNILIRLAARAYELEKGRAPARLEDLVPEYLSARPADPFTGQAINLPIPPSPRQ